MSLITEDMKTLINALRQNYRGRDVAYLQKELQMCTRDCIRAGGLEWHERRDVLETLIAEATEAEVTS